MRNKIIISILVLYTIVISVLFVINGRKLSASTGVNEQYELTIDSLKVHIETVNDRLPVRDKIYDSIGLVLNRISLSLDQLQKDRNKVKTDLSSDLASLSGKSIDSLKLIALKD